MTYAMEKFAGNSKMTSVCLNHKLNKNVQLSRTYYFSETLKFREEDHKLYFKHTYVKHCVKKHQSIKLTWELMMC